MANRNEEFFYHGTNAEIKPGEVIQPANQRGGEAVSHYDAEVYRDHPNYAYATPHLSMAQGFAARAVERNGGTGRVYKVGRNWGHPKSIIWKNPWEDEARSEGGFVVHEEVPYEEPTTRRKTDT